MNKEYVYTNGGKVTIIDEKGEKVQIEYRDNIDKVLIKENVIEQMEKQINELENKSKQHEKSKANKLFCIVTFLGGIIASLIAPLLVISMLTGRNLTSLVLDSAYSSYILSITTMVFPFGLFISSTLSIAGYIQYRNVQKEVQGINSELDYLNVQLEKEKKALIALENDKSNNNQNRENRIVKVNDIKELNKIRKDLAKYHELGYNVNKYNRYNKQGKLANILPNDIDINIAKEYLERNSKTLVRKKK